MKWNIEKRYLRIGIIIFLLVILAMTFQHSLENRKDVLALKETVAGTMLPIIWGLVFAYLLNPLLRFFERCFFTPLAKKIWKQEEKAGTRMKFSRALGIICTMVLFFVLVIGGLYLVVPQIYQSISSLVKDAPSYYASAEQWLYSLVKDESDMKQYFVVALDRLYTQALDYLNQDVLPNMDKIVAGITSGIVGGVKMLLNIILMVIISVYVLAEKEMLVAVVKKILYGFFPVERANTVLRGVRYADKVFGGFINGKIIDSFIIGAICYCFMVFAGLEYAVLISIIVGVTNIIPYFGPFIGAIPSVLILLMVEWRHGIIFAVFVVILQQVDGNIIGPLILGDRLNLSSMWILFSILIGGGFFGVAGMILGAPCFACIYAFVSSLCRDNLEKKHMPLETNEYYRVERVGPDGTIYELTEEERGEDDALRKDKSEEERGDDDALRKDKSEKDAGDRDTKRRARRDRKEDNKKEQEEEK